MDEISRGNKNLALAVKRAKERRQHSRWHQQYQRTLET